MNFVYLFVSYFVLFFFAILFNVRIFNVILFKRALNLKLNIVESSLSLFPINYYSYGSSRVITAD